MKRQIEVTINPTPQELAEAWWNLTGKEQAEFFNHIAVVSNFPKFAAFTIQINEAQAHGFLSENGRRIMEIIGEYGKGVKPKEDDR